MNLAVLLAASGIGVVLGALYAWSLWLTVRVLARARRPGLLLITSAALRIATIVGAAILLYADDLPALGAMMAGFVIARLASTRIAGRAASAGAPGSG